MNYLESNEYKNKKFQLKDEYVKCYNKIETYIQFANIYGVHQEACLNQVLDDFISAQAEGKQIDSLTGPNVRKYCDTIIQKRKSTSNRQIEVLSMVVGLPVTIMFLALFTTIFNNKEISITSSITIRAFSISYPVLSLTYFSVKWKTAKTFFDHAQASRIITTFVSIIFLGSIYVISIALDRILSIAIPIPLPLFISAFTPLLLLLIALFIISIKENRQFQIVPESEEFTIEQVTCHKCGKEHDMDYPRCPYCKNKNEFYI